jgi:hypothetical protein
LVVCCQKKVSATPPHRRSAFLAATISPFSIASAAMLRVRSSSCPPLYDLLATGAYPHLSSKFAMQIGKRAKLSELDEKG